MTSHCRLYLITPPLAVADVEAFAPRFQAVLKGGDVASALVRLAPGVAEADAKRVVARLLEIAAPADVALLVDRDARLAARVGADGVHVASRQRSKMPFPVSSPNVSWASARCACAMTP